MPCVLIVRKQPPISPDQNVYVWSQSKLKSTAFNRPAAPATLMP